MSSIGSILDAASDGSSGVREHLYSLPNPQSSRWANVVKYGIPSSQRIRVLQSANTPGIISTCVDWQCPTVHRVNDWTTIPDLLFWNPLRFYEDHIPIIEVWMEDRDSSTYTASSGNSDPGAMVSLAPSVSSSAVTVAADDDDEPLVAIEAAIVLRRSELTYETCYGLRHLQECYFRSQNFLFPPGDQFVGLLHGR